VWLKRKRRPGRSRRRCERSAKRFSSCPYTRNRFAGLSRFSRCVGCCSGVSSVRDGGESSIPVSLPRPYAQVRRTTRGNTAERVRPQFLSLRQRPFVGRSPSRTDFKNGLIFGPFHFRCVAGSTPRAPGVGSPETIFSRPPYHPVLVRSLLASILLRPTGRFRFEVRNLPPQPSLARNRISKFESRRGNTAHILQAALARPVASPTLRRGFRHRAFNAPVKRIVD